MVDFEYPEYSYSPTDAEAIAAGSKEVLLLFSSFEIIYGFSLLLPVRTCI